VPDHQGPWGRLPLVWAWLAIGLWVISYAVFKAQGVQGLDVDSAEQVYFAQSWQMGYGTRQPPLYTWMLLALKPASLPWAAMLEIARYALLLLWFAGVQAFACACGASRREQALVLVAHLGLSLVLWRVHDSLTHTVLAAALVTWGSTAVVLAFSQPRWWWLAGGLAALACMAKFNAGLWWLSALGAAWVVQRHSREVAAGALPWRHVLGGPMVFAVLLGAYGAWWLTQRMGAGALARQIAVANEQLPLWRPPVDVLLGTLEFALAGPALIGMVGLWAWRSMKALPTARPALSAADRWTLVQSFGALLVIVLLLMLTRGSSFKARWLWPVAPVLTVTLVLWAHRVVQARAALLASRSWHAVAVTALAVAMPMLALGLSALRWWEPALNAQRCRECWTDRPAASMAATLQALHGTEVRVIAGDTHLAGVLAAQSPTLRTWAATHPALPAPKGFSGQAGACVLAWSSMDRPQEAPGALKALQVAHSDGSAAVQHAWSLRHAPARQVWLQSQRVRTAACALASR
jgi:hypothetical protein